MKNIITLCFLLMMAGALNAQDAIWETIKGGYEDDIAYKVIRNSKGGYFVCGSTESKGVGKSDYYILKISEDGKAVQEKTYGGPDKDEARGMTETSDGNFVICGSTRSDGRGKYDLWIHKLDEKGSVLWSDTYGGKKDDEARYVIETFDQGFIIAGFSKSRGKGSHDAYILKLTKEGERDWRKTHGGRGRDIANYIYQTADSGYVFCGFTTTHSNGSYDFWISKIDKRGKAFWTQTYGDFNIEEACAVIPTDDKGYMVCGYQLSNKKQNFNILLIKLDQFGRDEWKKVIGENRMEQAFDMIQTSDGNFAICGYTNSVGSGKKDMYLVKVNKEGERMWDKTFGWEDNEEAFSLVETADGDFILAGYTESKGKGKKDLLIVKLSGH